jgi:hypothetical protein
VSLARSTPTGHCLARGPFRTPGIRPRSAGPAAAGIAPGAGERDVQVCGPVSRAWMKGRARAHPDRLICQWQRQGRIPDLVVSTGFGATFRFDLAPPGRQGLADDSLAGSVLVGECACRKAMTRRCRPLQALGRVFAEELRAQTSRRAMSWRVSVSSMASAVSMQVRGTASRWEPVSVSRGRCWRPVRPR